MSNNNRFGYKRMMWAILSRLSVTALLLYAADAVHERLAATPTMPPRIRQPMPGIEGPEGTLLSRR